MVKVVKVTAGGLRLQMRRDEHDINAVVFTRPSVGGLIKYIPKIEDLHDGKIYPEMLGVGIPLNIFIRKVEEMYEGFSPCGEVEKFLLQCVELA